MKEKAKKVSNAFSESAAWMRDYAKDCGKIGKGWIETQEVKESAIGATVGFAIGEALIGIPTFGLTVGLIAPHILKKRKA